jgi:hypothetical protein
MIPRKEQLNYRRSMIAKNGLCRRCKYCANKVLKTPHGYRCTVVGVEEPSRYAIEDAYVCDRWQYNGVPET